MQCNSMTLLVRYLELSRQRLLVQLQALVSLLPWPHQALLLARSGCVQPMCILKDVTCSVLGWQPKATAISGCMLAASLLGLQALISDWP